ncbi:MAG: GxxExxY protein [Puniceicoccaceae bacterium]
MELIYKEECYSIVGAAFEVFNELGSGFLEAVYQDALNCEFNNQSIPFVEKPKLQIQFKGITLNSYYSPDFVVYSKIIVEIKAVKSILDEHRAQTLNYLKATGLKLAVLINFGNPKKLEYERLLF